MTEIGRYFHRDLLSRIDQTTAICDTMQPSEPPQPLEIARMPAIKARGRQRHPDAGLDYLRQRQRSELQTRWQSTRADSQTATQVLVVDFAPLDLDFGKTAQITQHSLIPSLDSPTPTALASEGKFDAVILGWQLAWLPQSDVLAQTLRVLRPEGLLLLCTLGADTLAQLRTAWSEVDDAPHVHSFVSLHQLGDQLLKMGFRQPVLDIDRVRVQYQDPSQLYADLRSEGFTNISPARRKTLTGKTRFARSAAALKRTHAATAPLEITWEFIYAIARAPADPARIRVAPPAMSPATTA